MGLAVVSTMIGLLRVVLGGGILLSLLQLGLLVCIRQPSGMPIWVISVDNQRIIRQTVDGAKRQALTNEIPGLRYPQWSPDGAHIAFEAQNGIYHMDYDGRNLTRVVDANRPAPPTGYNGEWIIELDGWSDDNAMIVLIGWREQIDGALSSLDAEYISVDLNGNQQRIDSHTTSRNRLAGRHQTAPTISKTLRGWPIAVIGLLGVIITIGNLRRDSG